MQALENVSTARPERMPTAATGQLVDRLGIDAAAADRRRRSVRLGDEDCELLAGLATWAGAIAPAFAADFYELVFTVTEAREFFQRTADRHAIPLAELRTRLEVLEAEYFCSIFAGASTRFDVPYVESRLRIGQAYDRLGLPLQWYVGMHAEYVGLFREHLRAKGLDPATTERASDALHRVLCLDVQTVLDAFWLALVEDAGISVEELRARRSEGDLSDGVKQAMATLNQQATALADGALSDPCLDSRVPGPLGGALARVATTLRASTAQVDESSAFLNCASGALTALSERMAANAEATANQVSHACLASGVVAKSILSVTTASDALTTSIRAIAENAQSATEVARSAARVADAARSTVAELGVSSGEIGKIVRVVTTITQQTRLLALNATIEAARAGNAGRGFAVVAEEVKDLAKETAGAAEDISRKVDTIRRNTERVVSAIDEFSDVIARVCEIQRAIASAVDEQTVTTRGIACSITEASQGSIEIAQSLDVTATGARSTAEGCSELRGAMGELSEHAARLRRVVERSA
jgi:methyl-accepting chemotaxis protein